MRWVIDRLIHSLEAFTRDASNLKRLDAERLVELAAVVTAHAVALEALRKERADKAWREAHTPAPAPAPLPLDDSVELPARLAA